MSEKQIKKYRKKLAEETAMYFNATKEHIENQAVRKFFDGIVNDSFRVRLRIAWKILVGAKK